MLILMKRKILKLSISGKSKLGKNKQIEIVTGIKNDQKRQVEVAKDIVEKAENRHILAR